MKFMSTFLALSMLLCATAPAMARHNNNRTYVRSNVNAYRGNVNAYGGRSAAGVFNQQRAANYVVQQQQAAAMEAQRQQMNNYYNNGYSQLYPYNPYTGGSYYYGNQRNSILNSIFR
jgi:hypothetical protein